jgi:HPt (histidine-containing phosphotransfer) domain-containing protein
MDRQIFKGTTGSAAGEPLAAGKCEPREAIARLGGLDELYADILGRFLDDTSGVIGSLRTFAQAGNAKKTCEAAHSLKGAAAMCGAAGVAGVAAAIEHTAQSGHCGSLPQLIRRLELELENARTSLASFRRAGPRPR